MFFTEWEILLVDDEPDVLSISKLAMQGFDVYGLPLKIHTAESKAEAIEFLRNEPGRMSNLSVIFIDVVMETDSAGLELCQFIRGEMQNKTTQLFIRTGQPGTAPERAVIDGYDINGYFTKAEATEDKLYSLVKSGVRQSVWSRLSLSTVRMLSILVANARSRAGIAQGLQRDWGGGLRRFQARVAFAIEDSVIDIGLGEQAAVAMRDRLDPLEGTPLGPNGDKYVADERSLLIKVAAQPATAETCLLIETTFTPSDDQILMMHQALTGLGTAWAQA